MLLDDLLEIIDPENSRGTAGKREVYKTIYRLKSEKHIFALRSGVFLVGAPENSQDTVRLIEQYYWEIVQAFIRREVRSEYIIAGPKALEFHIGDMSTPSILIVYSKSTSKILKISPRHKIIFKTIEAGRRVTGNFFPKLMKFSLKRELPGVGNVRFLTLEAAILDALLVHSGGLQPDEYLVRKFLDRFADVLSGESLGKLVSMRYISSINRLRERAKELGYEKLYHDCIAVIKTQ
ncbi:MAG: hypothetical protein ACOYN2_04980 [Patescibacteria group bacterium]